MLNNEIPESLLNKLIQAGKATDLSQISSFFTPQEQRDFGYIMSLRPEAWFLVAENLRNEYVIALIKCLTITEMVFDDWRGGSVSPVIWLFKHLSSHAPGLSNYTANWVLANTHNNYLPFGSDNFGAKSINELSKFKKLSVERKHAILEAESKRQELAKERRAQEATRALFGAVKRNDIKAVKALLLKGADILAKDSEGLTIVELAKIIGSEKVLELIKSKDSGV